MNPLIVHIVLGLLFFSQIGLGVPLDTWTWRNPLPTGNDLHSIGYGNGLFVAVGAFGTIVTSADGVNWTLRQWSSDSTLSGIAYGNGQFVAVGYSDTDGSEAIQAILTSTDGMDWVQHPQGTNNFNVNSITFGNGLFVAVGFATIVTSVDGVTWIEQHSGMPYGLSGIAYGNGQFVAVGSLGINSAIVSSADGVNWVERQLGTQYSGHTAVAYGNGQFVTVGNVDTGMNSPVILTSSDGAHWVQREYGTQAGTYVYLHGIVYGNGQFVAVAEGRITILTSSDGVTWLQRQAGTQNVLFSVAYGNGQFVAVGDGGAILASANVTNWVQRRSGSSDQLNGIAYGNGQFVAVGQVNTPDTAGITVTPSILTSTDGAAWVQRKSALPSGFLSGVAYGNGQFVVVCNGDVETDTSPILTSADGVTWTQRQTGESYWLSGVAFDGTQFIAVSLSGGVLTSPDGVNWVKRQSELPDQRLRVNGVAYGNGLFVAVGGRWEDNGFADAVLFTTIRTSTDGVNWVERPSGTVTNYWFFGVVYGNGQFVAVGSRGGPDRLFGFDGIVVTSTDGVNWVERRAESNPSLRAVGYGNGRFVAAGNGILSSSDGVTWIAQPAGIQALSGIAYGNGRFVTVGDNGRILESGSIITVSLTHNAASGRPTLSLSGPIGLDYTIQSSSDLKSWQNLTNIVGAQPTNVIFDSLPAAPEHVFYRAHSQ